jgi:hypothetical protein
MALTATGIHDLAVKVRDCVCAALTSTAAEVEDYPGCPCRVCVVPGVPAWDSCFDPCTGEQGGQLTVHVARLYPSTTFPQPDTSVQGTPGCKLPQTTVAELVVTLLRCAPMPSEDGCPPSCDEMEASARILHIDAATVYNAIMCCLPTTAGRRGRRFLMGEQRTIGPQGGCVGIEQRVLVALSGCAPCPGDSGGG